MHMNVKKTIVYVIVSAIGLATLSRNQLLDKSAQIKCDDMVTNNYWSHDRPTGEKSWAEVLNLGYDYYKD